jgi:hypothetical protein
MNSSCPLPSSPQPHQEESLLSVYLEGRRANRGVQMSAEVLFSLLVQEAKQLASS